MLASPGHYWRRTPSSSPPNRGRQSELYLLFGATTRTALVEQKTGQTGARGTRSTYERKSLPNDRGASARLASGPECMALISGRLELRSLSFLAHGDAAKETGIKKYVDTMGKSLERLSDAGFHWRPTKLIYPNHRLPPWLTGDAPRDRSNRLLDDANVGRPHWPPLRNTLTISVRET